MCYVDGVGPWLKVGFSADVHMKAQRLEQRCSKTVNRNPDVDRVGQEVSCPAMLCSAVVHALQRVVFLEEPLRMSVRA